MAFFKDMASFKEKLETPTFLQAALAIGVILTLIFFVKLYRVRRYVRQLQKQGLVRFYPHSKYCFRLIFITTAHASTPSIMGSSRS